MPSQNYQQRESEEEKQDPAQAVVVAPVTNQERVLHTSYGKVNLNATSSTVEDNCPFVPPQTVHAGATELEKPLKNPNSISARDDVTTSISTFSSKISESAPLEPTALDGFESVVMKMLGTRYQQLLSVNGRMHKLIKNMHGDMISVVDPLLDTAEEAETLRSECLAPALESAHRFKTYCAQSVALIGLARRKQNLERLEAMLMTANCWAERVQTVRDSLSSLDFAKALQTIGTGSCSLELQASTLYPITRLKPTQVLLLDKKQICSEFEEAISAIPVSADSFASMGGSNFNHNNNNNSASNSGAVSEDGDSNNNHHHNHQNQQRSNTNTTARAENSNEEVEEIPSIAHFSSSAFASPPTEEGSVDDVSETFLGKVCFRRWKSLCDSSNPFVLDVVRRAFCCALSHGWRAIAKEEQRKIASLQLEKELKRSAALREAAANNASAVGAGNNSNNNDGSANNDPDEASSLFSHDESSAFSASAASLSNSPESQSMPSFTGADNNNNNNKSKSSKKKRKKVILVKKTRPKAGSAGKKKNDNLGWTDSDDDDDDGDNDNESLEEYYEEEEEEETDDEEQDQLGETQQQLQQEGDRAEGEESPTSTLSSPNTKKRREREKRQREKEKEKERKRKQQEAKKKKKKEILRRLRNEEELELFERLLSKEQCWWHSNKMRSVFRLTCSVQSSLLFMQSKPQVVQAFANECIQLTTENILTYTFNDTFGESKDSWIKVASTLVPSEMERAVLRFCESICAFVNRACLVSEILTELFPDFSGDPSASASSSSSINSQSSGGGNDSSNRNSVKKSGLSAEVVIDSMMDAIDKHVNAFCTAVPWLRSSNLAEIVSLFQIIRVVVCSVLPGIAAVNSFSSSSSSSTSTSSSSPNSQSNSSSSTSSATAAASGSAKNIINSVNNSNKNKKIVQARISDVIRSVDYRASKTISKFAEKSIEECGQLMRSELFTAFPATLEDFPDTVRPLVMGSEEKVRIWGEEFRTPAPSQPNSPDKKSSRRHRLSSPASSSSSSRRSGGGGGNNNSTRKRTGSRMNNSSFSQNPVSAVALQGDLLDVESPLSKQQLEGETAPEDEMSWSSSDSDSSSSSSSSSDSDNDQNDEDEEDNNNNNSLIKKNAEKQKPSAELQKRLALLKSSCKEVFLPTLMFHLFDLPSTCSEDTSQPPYSPLDVVGNASPTFTFSSQFCCRRIMDITRAAKLCPAASSPLLRSVSALACSYIYFVATLFVSPTETMLLEDDQTLSEGVKSLVYLCKQHALSFGAPSGFPNFAGQMCQQWRMNLPQPQQCFAAEQRTCGLLSLPVVVACYRRCVQCVAALLPAEDVQSHMELYDGLSTLTRWCISKDMRRLGTNLISIEEVASHFEKLKWNDASNSHASSQTVTKSLSSMLTGVFDRLRSVFQSNPAAKPGQGRAVRELSISFTAGVLEGIARVSKRTHAQHGREALLVTTSQIFRHLKVQLPSVSSKLMDAMTRLSSIAGEGNVEVVKGFISSSHSMFSVKHLVAICELLSRSNRSDMNQLITHQLRRDENVSALAILDELCSDWI